MRLELYSHNGAEKKIPYAIKQPIINKLKTTEFTFKIRCSKAIRNLIDIHLKQLGWSKPVSVIPNSRITINAVNEDVGLCLQFGNMARFYADLLKMQVYFQNNHIKSGIYIIPTRFSAKKIGSNVVNFERVQQELYHYREIVTMPLLVIGVEGKPT